MSSVAMVAISSSVNSKLECRCLLHPFYVNRFGDDDDATLD